MLNKYSVFFPLENSFGFLAYRTVLEMKTTLQRAFRKNGYNITTEQWSILLALWEREGRTQQELADKTRKDKANITRFVDLLAKEGFVTRRPDPRDRRKYSIYLTAAGRMLRDRLMPIAFETLTRMTEGIPQRDFDVTRRTLTRLYENIAALGNTAPQQGNR